MPNRELDLLSPDADDFCDTLILTKSRNGQGGYVRGLEFALQHSFNYLPGFWSGFGGVINYTYADSGLDAETILKPDGSVDDFIPEFPLQDTSEHTLNLTAFWEMDGKLIRLAYNTRSDYLTNRSANEYGSVWVEGFDTLDLSASWDITKWASVNFQAVNLLDTVTRQYSTIRPNVNGSNLPAEASDLGSQPTHRTARLSNTGTMYRLGLRLTF
jgi:TonB-dependent receptor